VEASIAPEQRAVYGLTKAAEVFTPEIRESISRFLNIAPDDPAFVPFLAVAASYGLDPLMGDIWLIPQKVKVKDAQGRETKVERYRPATGDSGYLKVARRHSEFLGVEGDVVHANDTLTVRTRRADDLKDLVDIGGGRVLVHEWSLGGGGENPAFARGPVIGGWAVARWKGRSPTFYWAPIQEHGKTKEYGGQKEWAGSWGYTSAMILKAARSYVLRISSGVSGVVPVDEILEGDPVKMLEPPRPPSDLLPATTDPDLKARFDEAVERSREVDPNLWHEAKVEMYVGTLNDQDALEELIERIETETAAERERVAQRMEEVITGEIVPDADIVDGTAIRLPQEEVEALRHEGADLVALQETGEADEGQITRLAEIRDLLDRAGVEGP
jgi:hypothetical protein